MEIEAISEDTKLLYRQHSKNRRNRLRKQRQARNVSLTSRRAGGVSTTGRGTLTSAAAPVTARRSNVPNMPNANDPTMREIRTKFRTLYREGNTAEYYSMAYLTCAATKRTVWESQFTLFFLHSNAMKIHPRSFIVNHARDDPLSDPGYLKDRNYKVPPLRRMGIYLVASVQVATEERNKKYKRLCNAVQKRHNQVRRAAGLKKEVISFPPPVSDEDVIEKVFNPARQVLHKLWRTWPESETRDVWDEMIGWMIDELKEITLKKEFDALVNAKVRANINARKDADVPELDEAGYSSGEDENNNTRDRDRQSSNVEEDEEEDEEDEEEKEAEEDHVEDEEEEEEDDEEEDPEEQEWEDSEEEEEEEEEEAAEASAVSAATAPEPIEEANEDMEEEQEQEQEQELEQELEQEQEREEEEGEEEEEKEEEDEEGEALGASAIGDHEPASPVARRRLHYSDEDVSDDSDDEDYEEEEQGQGRQHQRTLPTRRKRGGDGGDDGNGGGGEIQPTKRSNASVPSNDENTPTDCFICQREIGPGKAMIGCGSCAGRMHVRCFTYAMRKYLKQQLTPESLSCFYCRNPGASITIYDGGRVIQSSIPTIPSLRHSRNLDPVIHYDRARIRRYQAGYQAVVGDTLTRARNEFEKNLYLCHDKDPGQFDCSTVFDLTAAPTPRPSRRSGAAPVTPAPEENSQEDSQEENSQEDSQEAEENSQEDSQEATTAEGNETETVTETTTTTETVEAASTTAEGNETETVTETVEAASTAAATSTATVAATSTATVAATSTATAAAASASAATTTATAAAAAAATTAAATTSLGGIQLPEGLSPVALEILPVIYKRDPLLVKLLLGFGNVGGVEKLEWAAVGANYRAPQDVWKRHVGSENGKDDLRPPTRVNGRSPLKFNAPGVDFTDCGVECLNVMEIFLTALHMNNAEADRWAWDEIVEDLLDKLRNQCFNEDGIRILGNPMSLTEDQEDFAVLICLLLSGRTRDRACIKYTIKLAYRGYLDLDKLAGEDVIKIQNIIHGCGFQRKRALFLLDIAYTLKKRFDGKVPKNKELLLELIGVGDKTAILYLNTAAKISAGCGPDIHVRYCTEAFGFAPLPTSRKTIAAQHAESSLLTWIPKKRVRSINKIFGSMAQVLTQMCPLTGSGETVEEDLVEAIAVSIDRYIHKRYDVELLWCLIGCIRQHYRERSLRWKPDTTRRKARITCSSKRKVYKGQPTGFSDPESD